MIRKMLLICASALSLAVYADRGANQQWVKDKFASKEIEEKVSKLEKNQSALVNSMSYTAWENWPDAANKTEQFWLYTTVASNTTVRCIGPNGLLTDVTLALPMNNGVKIEWGDGYYIEIGDIDLTAMRRAKLVDIKAMYDQSLWESEGIIRIKCTHTYTDTNKHIVCITGKDFYKIGRDGFDTKRSLVSRVFDADLPIANWHSDLSTFAAYSLRLQSVKIPDGICYPGVKKADYIFENDTALLSVSNMASAFPNADTMSYTFKNCTMLKTADLRMLPVQIQNSEGTFMDCAQLSVDVMDLLPLNGFASESVSMKEIFRRCANLTCAPANTNALKQMLWRNSNVKWKDTTYCFSGCTKLANMVPVAWGGLNTEAKERQNLDTADRVEIGITGSASVSPSVSISPSAKYPSAVYAPFATAIGYDNEVGKGYLTDGGKTSYAIGIGTSISMPYQHDYGFGAQIYATVPNAMVLGYGASATNEWSTVIGKGIRPNNSPDKVFTDRATADLFLKSYTSVTNTMYVDYCFKIGNTSDADVLIVTAIRTTPDATTGWYVNTRVMKDWEDHIPGGHRWSYGKSHGRGTFNIVAIGDGVNDYGLANVFINDRSLADWVGIRNGEPVYKPVYDKGIWKDPVLCEHDMTVAIGVNAMATETASSCQAIAIGRDALSAGSATVAVGPNSFAIGAQAAAFGWRANAVGAHSVAIGAAKKSGQNYYKDGIINPDSDLCLAEGAESIAIGFNAKAKANKGIAIGDNAQAVAEGAAQIGTGINSTPNTLKFQNITLVADGKIIGTFDPKELDPKKVDITEAATTEELTVTAMPHVVNTVIASKPCGPGTEIYVEPKGSRNYDIFLPNTAELRAGLPITMDSEVTGSESIFVGDLKNCFKLPAMIKVQQPHESVVMFTVSEIKDKTDWTPVITNCNIVCTNTAATGFSGKFITTGQYSLEGTSLHAGTVFQVVYPTSATTTVTNDLQTITAGSKFMSGTFYNTVSKVESTATGLWSATGETSWFKIIYKTVNGEAAVITKTIDMLH